MIHSRTAQHQQELLTSNFCVVRDARAADLVVGYSCHLSCAARPVPGGRVMARATLGEEPRGWRRLSPGRCKIASTRNDFLGQPVEKTHRFSSQALYLGWGSGSLLLKS